MPGHWVTPLLIPIAVIIWVMPVVGTKITKYHWINTTQIYITLM